LQPFAEMLALLSAETTPTMHLVLIFYDIAWMNCSEFESSAFVGVSALAKELKKTLKEKYSKLWNNARNIKGNGNDAKKAKFAQK